MLDLATFLDEVTELSEARYGAMLKTARSGSTLDMKPTPRELGMHAKRTGDDHRGSAYSYKVPGTALALGAATGTTIAATGKSTPEMLQSGIRAAKKAKIYGGMLTDTDTGEGGSGAKKAGRAARRTEDAAKRAKTVAEASAKAAKGGADPTSEASKTVGDAVSDFQEGYKNPGKAPPKKDYAKSLGEAGEWKLKDALKNPAVVKRLKKAGKGAAIAGAIGGGLRLAANIAGYHGSKSVSSRGEGDRRRGGR